MPPSAGRFRTFIQGQHNRQYVINNILPKSDFSCPFIIGYGSSP